jgi:chorismate synthase
MSGNTFGKAFRVTTFGESHGPALGVIIDGMPPRVPFDEARLAAEMARRRPGQSKLVTQRQEADVPEVLSGVFAGRTTGAPLAMLIRNDDTRSRDYDNIKDLFRPGHADFTYWAKYGHRDHRGGGRSSGRETAARVAAGAVAAMVLDPHGIDVWGWTAAVGTIVGERVERSFIEQNPVRAADPEQAQAMADAIEAARKDGDSLGAVVELKAEGVPAGLGEPAFDKLDAAVAAAMMGIGTVKGVEIGAGFAAAMRRGSENNDPFVPGPDGTIRTRTNHHGGILGGISSGMPITVRCAIKPTSSIVLPQDTVDTAGRPVEFRTHGRHDPCIGPRFVPVGEAMLRLVLVDFLIRQLGLDALAPAR